MELLGKWILAAGQPFAGLWFEFLADSSYHAELPGLFKVVSAGTYTVAEGGVIDMNQTKHSMGMLGKFAGRYAIDGDMLKMALAPAPGGLRPVDLSAARNYKRG